MAKKIIKNAIQCLLCDSVVESKETEDLSWCKCHSCFVTGGLEFQQIGGTRRDLSQVIRNLIEVKEIEDDELSINK